MAVVAVVAVVAVAVAVAVAVVVAVVVVAVEATKEDRRVKTADRSRRYLGLLYLSSYF